MMQQGSGAQSISYAILGAGAPLLASPVFQTQLVGAGLLLVAGLLRYSILKLEKADTKCHTRTES